MRERKRADSRAATVEAAFRLFGEHGFDEVTVADICASADIGRRTFHRYFASKEDLLGVPVQEMAERLTDALGAVPDGTSDAAALRAALTEIARYVLTHRAQLDLYRRITATSRTLRLSAFGHFPEQEQELTRRLTARRGETGPPSLTTRLLVARAVAAFRVWLERVLETGVSGADALALFDEAFDADPWLRSP
ncbi:TetR family transcriptional regulator [Actinocorallia herbida]|uniref:TetR family transcriptional regulator n=1 Tax=Actinocorallia herbida TaxID=58109 RepID=UPI001B87E880|nr:TetR family transcriptional regulator [Actinocorallia herbida]